MFVKLLWEGICVCKKNMEGTINHSLWLFQMSEGGPDHLLPKFEHIFVADITFFPFLLCRYFYYQLVAYCVCFQMICEMSL